MYTYIFICIYIVGCVHACMRVCVYTRVYLCLYVSVPLCAYAHICYVCMLARLYVCMCAYMHICLCMCACEVSCWCVLDCVYTMYACMYVCIHACTQVCIYVVPSSQIHDATHPNQPTNQNHTHSLSPTRADWQAFRPPLLRPHRLRRRLLQQQEKVQGLAQFLQTPPLQQQQMALQHPLLEVEVEVLQIRR